MPSRRSAPNITTGSSRCRLLHQDHGRGHTQPAVTRPGPHGRPVVAAGRLTPPWRQVRHAYEHQTRGKPPVRRGPRGGRNARGTAASDVGSVWIARCWNRWPASQLAANSEVRVWLPLVLARGAGREDLGLRPLAVTVKLTKPRASFYRR